MYRYTNLAENINPCDVDPLSFITPTPHNFTFQTISHDTIREVIMQTKTTKRMKKIYAAIMGQSRLFEQFPKCLRRLSMNN